MKHHLSLAGAACAALALSLLHPAARSQDTPPPVPPEAQGDVQPQTRGPVHEGFAQPNSSGPLAGPTIDRQPPPVLPEEPPAQRPEGDNIIWVPGYWGWDTARTDFVWVSGCWRTAPPDRKWVPGYWNKTESGYQWVSGFWAPASQQELPFLPKPPATLDQGPSTSAPGDGSIWVPGCWLYRESRYRWRPGFWCEAQSSWIWQPAQYYQTPAGYVFVDGYWDYALPRRGLLFAPACFRGTPWDDPTWTYQPDYCVGVPALLSSLWVGPSLDYCFGDYYGPTYSRLGYSPWFTYGRRFHDPLFSYYRWFHRGNAGWYNGLVRTYRGRLDGTLMRPPRTLAAQAALVRSGRLGAYAGVLRVARPLSAIPRSEVRLTRLSRSELTTYRGVTRTYRQVTVGRRNVERGVKTGTVRSASLSLARVPSARGGRVTASAGVRQAATSRSVERQFSSRAGPAPQARAQAPRSYRSYSAEAAGARTPSRSPAEASRARSAPIESRRGYFPPANQLRSTAPRQGGTAPARGTPSAPRRAETNRYFRPAAPRGPVAEPQRINRAQAPLARQPRAAATRSYAPPNASHFRQPTRSASRSFTPRPGHTAPRNSAPRAQRLAPQPSRSARAPAHAGGASRSAGHSAPANSHKK
jgi:hypothetical protein